MFFIGRLQSDPEELQKRVEECFYLFFSCVLPGVANLRSRQSRRHGVFFVFWVYFGVLLVICESCRKLQVFFLGFRRRPAAKQAAQELGLFLLVARMVFPVDR